MTYQAVRTTGIYCVPSCSARPNPGNVVAYETAAAAEAAGYRACLRCRPYRASADVMIDGPELVCRAVGLIADGALDDAAEAALGARLGVSPRHLRRLFAEHLGVTPDQLGRSRRAHFARRLLDDTDLRVADIAFASGFGSVRQLNRACLELFRATPTALRARRRAADRLVADGGLTLRLPFREPLPWPTMVGYFGRRAIRGVEHVEGGVYRRTIVVDGAPGVLEITAGGADHLVLRAHLPQLSGLIHVVQRARRIFGLDVDPAPADARLARDPVLRPLVRAAPGLRVPGTWDPFETGVRAIIGQQVSVTGASTVTARLVERLGTPVPGLARLGLSHTFPSPATVADGDLSALGMPGARARAIAAFAAAVADGKLPLDRTIDADELVARIVELPGLGPWTAHYLALRLGEPDAFPAADLGLRRAVDPGGALSTAALAERAEAWRPHRGVAAIRLWLGDDPT
jgi:AraC family transcriptional regulator of adaptative response / DNA-3-methyladenine glycosylase II